jgi:hypothetical protein
MAIRQVQSARPSLQVVDTTATGAGIVDNTVYLDQDISNIVVQAFCGALSTVTANVLIQTTPDGGTTWYDCCQFPQMTTTVSKAASNWAVIPVDGVGVGFHPGSTFTASAGAVGAGSYTGLPLLSNYIRVRIVYGGGAGTNPGVTVNVFETSQSARN